MKFYTTQYISPLGTILIQATQEAVCTLQFVRQGVTPANHLPDILLCCLQEIEAYFQGSLISFSVPLQMSGTNFQIAVWQALQTIPYGMTSSYQDIARHLNKPNAYRAVGHANKRNPCPLIVPCHRVVGKNGQLTGYNNGLWRKQWLIDHEKRHAPLQTEGLDQISSRNRCV